MVLTSRRPYPLAEDFQAIALDGLTREEFDQLLTLRNAIAHERFDEQLVDRLFRISNGNAMIASVAAAAVREGLVNSWQELFDHLRGFRTPGFVGPDEGNCLLPVLGAEATHDSACRMYWLCGI